MRRMRFFILVSDFRSRSGSRRRQNALNGVATYVIHSVSNTFNFLLDDVNMRLLLYIILYIL